VSTSLRFAGGRRGGRGDSDGARATMAAECRRGCSEVLIEVCLQGAWMAVAFTAGPAEHAVGWTWFRFNQDRDRLAGRRKVL
jgi:hypothetical protein